VQLLLLVDYVFDWARDVYRPSILRRLKSLATGKACDQISLTTDSNIASLKRQNTHISDWIQPPPDGSLDKRIGPKAWIEQTLLPLPLVLNTPIMLRSADHIEFKLDAVYITDDNVRCFLQGADRSREVDSAITLQKPARDILNFLSRWDEILILTGNDLEILERVWTGENRVKVEGQLSVSSTLFYCVIEFRTFMSPSWKTSREIAYLAISVSAFDGLIRYANWRTARNNIVAIPRIARPCSGQVLVNSINCLRSASQRQALMAALSCTCFSICTLPKRHSLDCKCNVEALSFKTNRNPLLPKLIQRLRRINQIHQGSSTFISPAIAVPEDAKNTIVPFVDSTTTIPTPFLRNSSGICEILQHQEHTNELCPRCQISNRYADGNYLFPSSAEIILSPYNTLLAESLVPSSERNEPPCCVFLLDVDRSIGLSGVKTPQFLTQIFSSGFLYHTIQHPLPKSHNERKGDILWNLPFQYSTDDLNHRLDNSDCVPRSPKFNASARYESHKYIFQYWMCLQHFLHLLSVGIPWDNADSLVDLMETDGLRPLLTYYATIR
jgi:hypothetical protein